MKLLPPARLFLILTVAVSIVATFIPLRAMDDTTRYNLMGDADEAIAKGDWESAERHLVEAINGRPGDPSNILMMSNLGIVRFNMGRDSLALATLNDAVSLAPASVTVRLNRALIRSGMGDTEGARDDYRQVIALDSTVVEPHFYLAVMALAQGDTLTAGRHSRRLEVLAPDGTETAFVMASLLSAKGQPAEAIPYYTILLKKDAQPDYYAARALCYLQTDDLNAASDDIAAGIALDPTDGELYLYRAILNKMRFRPDDAKADARKAADLGIPAQRIAAAMK